MAIQEELITRVVIDKDVLPVVTAGVEPSWFDTDNRKVWAFLLNHWKKYGKIPSKTAVKRQFPTFEFHQTAENMDYHVDQMVEARQDFLLNEAISEAVQERPGEKAASIQERISLLGSKVIHLQGVGSATQDHVWGSAKERMDRWKDYEEAKKHKGLRGIPTPWKPLTDMLLGWQDQQMICVSARPGIGKSWFLCLVAFVAKKNGHKVLFFSNEMSDLEMGRRMDALDCGVSASRLRYAKLTPQEEKLYKAYCKKKDEKTAKDGDIILVTDDGDADNRTGTMLVRAKIDTHQPALLLIDGAYLMRNNPSDSMTTNVYTVSRDIKRICRQCELPGMVTVQAGRPKNSREAKYGGDGSNIQWGDAWLQDSDAAMELIQNPTMKADFRMRVRLNKQRDGPLGEVETRWDFESMNFETLSTTDQSTIEAEESELLL